MNLVALQAAVIDRCGLISTDQAVTTTLLNPRINAALHWLDTRNPRGWSWQRVEGTYVTGVDYVVAFTTVFTAPAEVRKISEVRVNVDDVLTPALTRMSRGDALDLYPDLDATATPEVYAVDGTNLWLRPTTTSGLALVVFGVREEVDLSGTASPLMPVSYHDVIVEYAAYLTLRRLHETAEASEALRVAQARAMEMIRDDRQFTGPGQVSYDRTRDSVV